LNQKNFETSNPKFLFMGKNRNLREGGKESHGGGVIIDMGV
jgi:hypothetical protein